MTDLGLSADDLAAFAEDAPKPETNASNILATITRTAAELRAAQSRVTDREADLKKAQEEVRRLEEFVLPDLMAQAEQEKLRTSDGFDVELTETLMASIPAANLPPALKWLIDNGQQAIIKREMKLLFGKSETEKAEAALKMILEAGLTPSDKQFVHPQTLAAAIRELLAAGADVPLDLLGAHRRRIVKVKPIKGK